MKKFVMYDKLSKKEKKKLDSVKRRTWGDYGCKSPTTKIVTDKKKQENRQICREKVRVF